MHIQEIIIEGFKSYAQRTVVSGFDPQFNAITGLNGTGKSNILDSICFVLGISNLSQVRVGNLQELVYKQGQAGVSKATVTIVFNNSDPSGSPVGYEAHKTISVTRQVVIGGKNKYIINGHTVQQSQVQNLFHSVQLNVNNPHFLIMQGRITKVLNMKPAEILSMIEEAAGTRMYETKKQAAVKTMEKKQLKVDEITACMNTDILPTLENLKTERQNYNTWLSNGTEVEKLERFLVAFEFAQCEQKVNSSEQDKVQLQADMESFENDEKNELAEAQACSVRIEGICEQRDREMEGSLQNLKKAENDLSKELVKQNTLLSNQKELLATEQANKQTLQKQLDLTTSQLAEKQQRLGVVEGDLIEKEARAQEAEHGAVCAQDRYQNAVAGVVTDATDTDTLSLPEQVATWEKRAREAHSNLQTGALKVEHLRTSIAQLKKQQLSQRQAYDQAQAVCVRSKDKLAALERRHAQLSSLLCNEKAINVQVASLRASTQAQKDTAEKLSAQLEARLSFEYASPVKGFDRSKVKGLVAKLFTVPEKLHATALEVVAGAKLYQVVVDNEQTGKLLLQHGQLKKRVTILPLSRIDNRRLPTQVVERAKTIARAHNSTAYLALELVNYDSGVSAAIEHVFGTTLVCASPEAARAIAFDDQIQTKTVTFDGDVYDPSGTLTGGSKNDIGKLLAKLDDFSTTTAQLSENLQTLTRLQTELQQLSGYSAELTDVGAEMEVVKQELAMNTQKVNTSNYSNMANEIEDHEKQLASLNEEAVSLMAVHDKATLELSKLKDSESALKKSREKAMKDLEVQVKTANKAAQAARADSNKCKLLRDSVVAEVSSLTKEVDGVREQLEGVEESLGVLMKGIAALTDKVAKCRVDYESAKAALVDKQSELSKCSADIKLLEANREKHIKAAHASQLEARKCAHKLKQWEKDFKDASRQVTVLLKAHPWIEREKEYFGVAGSAFDFDAAGLDMNACSKRLKELKASQDKLAKKINKKVVGMIEKAETEYAELARKREVILKDKAKIESVIEELDVKKQQALRETWVRVNRDFGSIFSMLLPGVTAKLEPTEGTDVSDGLEVRVAFNGVWKESLTELSGGQRSLLALSLILSLLLFKPAPMYILDEVDAALDLSHTQNIGLMLRTHFTHSQFIVVSLKEGMFNNANVIFRTKFVDGVSAVTRTVVGGNKSMLSNSTKTASAIAVASENEPENEQEAPRKKGKKQLVI